MITAGLVEDDPDFQKLLTMLIAADPEIELIGVYASAEDFLSCAELAKCSVVVMDINLPGVSGIECVGLVKSRYPNIHVTMCTVFEDDDQLFESLKAGAVGYILKHKAVDDITTAIKEVYNGGSPISPGIARKLVHTFQHSAKPASVEGAGLTAREREILELLTQGFRYKEIADQLHISQETVRTHVRNLYEKLQVQSRTEAINKVFGAPKL